MPRFTSATLVSLLATLFLSIRSGAEPPSPLDLVRGLRENQMPDLALEYLQEIENGKLTNDVKTLLTLERAKTLLMLAQLESDEAVREAAIGRAKMEFDTFLKSNASHPRAVEASLALAGIFSIQAKAELNRAFRNNPIEGTDEQKLEKLKARKAAAAATRTYFKQASDLFGQAANRLTIVLADPALELSRKKSLTRESLEAEMQRGINQFHLAETYVNPQGKEVDERSKVLADAKKIFADLGTRDPNSSISWTAKAWSAMCDLEISEKAKAEEEFKVIRAEANRFPTGPAADGLRMVEFFEAQGKYLDALGSKQLQLVRQARTQVKNWLEKDKYRFRMTPERLSSMYYYAYLTQLEGMTGVVYDKSTPPKLKDVSSYARSLLMEAKREYQKILEFENEYSERAAQNRTATIRVLVGDATKPADQYTNFEDCQMAALVQLSNGNLESTKKSIELLERCRQLAGPTISPKDRIDLELTLAYAYWSGGRPMEASVLGEHLARTTKGSTAARAGLIAIESYIDARSKLDENDVEALQSDWNRAIELAKYIDKTFPNDPSVDGIRFRLGRLYMEKKLYREAFDMLGKIQLSYPSVASARLVESSAAYQLINSKESTLTAAQKADILRTVTAHAESVPMPSRKEELPSFFGLRNLLAQLHLSTMTMPGYTKAEQVARDAIQRATNATALDESERKSLAFASDEIRLRAVYMQALESYKKGQFKAASEKLLPSITEISKAGRATATKIDGDAIVVADSLDRFRRDFVLFALQTRIREGAIDPAAQLFDLLEKLGGSVEATTDALNRLVSLVRPQIDDLRKQGKDSEADQLSNTIASLIDRQISKPKLSTRTIALLGKSMRDLGMYDKAIEALKKVPLADPMDLEKRSSELNEEQRAAVVSHRIAQIELARAYRMSGKLIEAEAVLKTALGDDGKGWARAALDFRREHALLLEDQAFAAPLEKRIAGWTDARAAWTKIARDYASSISARLPSDPDARTRAIQDREKLIPIYLELVADEKRCMTRMVLQLQGGDPEKLQKSMMVIAQQVVDVEKSNTRNLSTSVKARFAEVLDEFPPLKKEYLAKGGKAFMSNQGDEDSPASPPASEAKVGARTKS